MSETVIIEAEARTTRGSSEGRRLRREGWFPGIVYGSGNEPQMVKVNEHNFKKRLHGHASEQILLDLAIKGQSSKKVLLQEVQHDAMTGGIIHADFQEVSMTEKIRVEVKLEVVGEPEGVKIGGGVLEQMLREVEIECLPGDLMESIEMDVSALKIGDTLTVGDITLDASKYEVLSDADQPVVSVAAPKVEEEAPVAAEAAEGEGETAGNEPEVIGEKKESEEE